MSDKKLGLALKLPSLLFIAVACTQISLALTQNLDPWKGGGFGMFSKLDGASERAFSCLVKDREGRSYLVSIEDSYDDPRSKLEEVFRRTAERSYTLPTQKNLKNLAEIILNTAVVAKERFDLRDVRWLEEDAPGAELVLPDWIKKSTQIYRLASRRDRDDEDIEKIYPFEVELKMWRLKFHPAEDRLKWHLVSSVHLTHKDV